MSEQELIERLAERLQQTDRLPVSVALWDAESIASYLLMTPDTVRRSVVVQPSFPAPLRIKTSSNPRPRWKAREVVKWAECQS